MGRNRQVRSNEFAEWLNRQMAAAGWGPTELSRRIGGVRHQSVSRWANGQVLPDMDKIPRLAELFGVDEAELARLAGRLSGEWQPTEISYEDALRMVQIKSPWFLPVEGIASAGPGAFQDGIWRQQGAHRAHAPHGKPLCKPVQGSKKPARSGDSGGQGSGE